MGNFLSHKCERSFSMKRNPRKINWTVLYRRKHKKGIMEEEVKRRTRRTQKFQRAIVGSTLSDIMARRNEKPEFRKAQRDEAIRALKEKKKVKDDKKKSEKSTTKHHKSKDKASKSVHAKAPRVGGKR